MAASFEKLPAEQRAILLAAYWKGQSMQECAEEARVPLGTVRRASDSPWPGCAAHAPRGREMTASDDAVPVIQHHVPDEALLARAAGTATEGASLAMACHVALCAACAARLAELESLGGVLLEAAGTAELPADALAKVMARLDAPRGARRRCRAVEVPEVLRTFGLPRPLQGALARITAPVRWRLVIPGVRAIDLRLAPGTDTVRLIAFKGGITIPLHDTAGPSTSSCSAALSKKRGRASAAGISPSGNLANGTSSASRPASRHRAGGERGEAAAAHAARAEFCWPLSRT